MSTTSINNKNSVSVNQKVETAKRVTTVENKMNQMRNTLKKHPIPLELLKK